MQGAHRWNQDASVFLATRIRTQRLDGRNYFHGLWSRVFMLLRICRDILFWEISFAGIGSSELGMLQPNRLPGKTKAAMAIIAPASLAREMVEFLKREGALDRGPRVVARHRL